MCSIDYHNSADYIQLLRSGRISNFHVLDYFTYVPDYLYKFKSFGKWNENQWKEDKHWKDIINGILFFCVPAIFNKNDPDDCKFQCNKDDVIKHLLHLLEEQFSIKHNHNVSNSAKNLVSNLTECFINCYLKRLQETSRICCFTENNETNKFMWDDDNFTSKGYGLCVKYKFNKEIFSPGTINCLPVAYTNENMDFTSELCLFMDLVQKYGDQISEHIDDPKVREFTAKASTYTLIKKQKYQNENEWRIVVPQNRYENYLTIKNENSENCKRNFISAMEAIYINSKCSEIPNWNDYYLAFIKDKCSGRGIDLFYYDEQSDSSYKID
ncbi:MAG: hypothetical protein IJQ99_05510 [Synergistaceae bacterium]|nr:hypothetical protein [Synergistaceae bacterium]